MITKAEQLYEKALLKRFGVVHLSRESRITWLLSLLTMKRIRLQCLAQDFMATELEIKSLEGRVEELIRELEIPPPDV